MDVEKVLCMVRGSGETSYAANSKLQEKVILLMRPLLEETVGGIYRNLLPEKMVVADLGCSSGPNTLLVVSEVIKIISNQCVMTRQRPPEGLVEEEKFDTFNLPYYAPSAEEVEAIVNLQGLFDITTFQTFQSNLDPFDDLDDDVLIDNVQSGANCAKVIRSILEPMIASHFGSAIVDDLFSRFATSVVKHLLKEKLKAPTLAISLKKKE